MYRIGELQGKKYNTKKLVELRDSLCYLRESTDKKDKVLEQIYLNKIEEELAELIYGLYIKCIRDYEPINGNYYILAENTDEVIEEYAEVLKFVQKRILSLKKIVNPVDPNMVQRITKEIIN